MPKVGNLLVDEELEHDLGTGEDEFTRLLITLEMVEGFSFQPVISESFDTLMEVYRRLCVISETNSWETVMIFPTYLVDQNLMSEKLFMIRKTANRKKIVMLYPQVSDEEFSLAWQTVCETINNHVNFFRLEWGCSLIIFGGEKVFDILRKWGPNIWAIRTGVYSFPAIAISKKEEAKNSVKQPAKPSLLGFLRNSSDPLANLAEISLSEGVFDEAETLTKMAIEIDEAVGDLENLAADLNLLACILVEVGRLTEAEPWLARAIGITRERKDMRNWVIGYMNMATILTMKEKFDKAEAWLRKAWEETKDQKELRTMVGEALINLLRKCNRFAEAALVKAKMTRQ